MLSHKYLFNEFKKSLPTFEMIMSAVEKLLAIAYEEGKNDGRSEKVTPISKKVTKHGKEEEPKNKKPVKAKTRAKTGKKNGRVLDDSTEAPISSGEGLRGTGTTIADLRDEDFDVQ